jgi:hypothetical protein
VDEVLEMVGLDPAGHGGPGSRPAADADTVYFHIYNVTDPDHIRLLGRQVPPQVT